MMFVVDVSCLFCAICRNRTPSEEPIMTYKDFIWFLLAEEDKSSQRRLVNNSGY